MMLASRVSSFIAATYIMSIYTDNRYLIKKVSVTGSRRRPIGKMGNGRLLAEAKSPIGTRVGTNGELDQGLLCQGCDCVCWSLGLEMRIRTGLTATEEFGGQLTSAVGW